MREGVSFCFLVTRDLVKEDIWREWFSYFDSVQFPYKVFTHCSNPDAITSEWLRSTLIPISKMKPSSWGFLMKSTLSLYEEAYTNSMHKWFTLHSESCVPIISPKDFISIYTQWKDNSFIKVGPIWWDVTKTHRANLHVVAADHRMAHSEWMIVSHIDLESILVFSKQNSVSDILLSGVCADESYVGTCLSLLNRLSNVKKEVVTFVDWKRSPNGNNPYTFGKWSNEDTMTINSAFHDNKYIMFLRKVSADMDDTIIRKLQAIKRSV